MNLFGQAKDLYKLQKQAKEIKKKLKNLHIEAEVEGIVVVISAEQEVQEVRVPEEMMTAENHTKLQNKLKEAFNKGIKKSQEVAAHEMRDLMGGMGMDMPKLQG
ncbi:MAG: DNA-binding protein YbaB [Oceanicoccus sp.]|jgi:DNA-binding protein YbaB